MPPEAFLMTGAATPFRLAEPCPVMQGPHCGPVEEGSFLVADAVTRDRSASIRVALWRCQFCGVLMIGLGQTGPALDGPPGTGVHIQEFTWLEEPAALLGNS